MTSKADEEEPVEIPQIKKVHRYFRLYWFDKT